MTTGTAEHIDATTAAAFFEVTYEKECLVAREEQLLFVDLWTNEFDGAAEHGSTVTITPITNLTAQTKNTSANAATIFETVTETNVTITIGTWEYNAIAIETFAKKQSNKDILSKYAPKQGYAIAHSMDAVLAGLVDDFTQTVGTLTQEITYDDMLRAIQYLDDANAPQSDRFIAVSPAQKAGFMKLDQFVNSDYSKINGSVNAAKKDAYLGEWMKIPVYMSTNVEGSNSVGHDNTVAHKQAIALCRQMKMQTHAQFDINYLAHKVAVEHSYGSGEIRDDHGVWLKGA